MHKVLQPTVVGKLELRNRFVRSATGDSTADPVGAVTDRSLKLYEELAAGGVGLIITGYAFVATHGQSTTGQYGIYSDDLLPGLRQLASTCHSHGAKVAVQIAHSGLRSTYLNSRRIVAIAPSEIEEWPLAPTPPPHRAIAEGEIEALIDDYVAAAVRGREAGFDAVQLHAAHGYMMSQFYSPITNRRMDRWGGSAENRRRFHIETIRRVRAAVGPDYPIFMKFGIMDDSEAGAGLAEGISALAAMAEAGLDAVEVSAGIGAGSKGPSQVVNDDVREDTYYRARSAKAKRETGIPLMLVGGVRHIETAEEIVESGDADLISMCRPLIREPGLIDRWLRGDYRRSTCISCNKCLGIMNGGQPLECGEERRIREAQRD